MPPGDSVASNVKPIETWHNICKHNLGHAQTNEQRSLSPIHNRTPPHPDHALHEIYLAHTTINPQAVRRNSGAKTKTRPSSMPRLAAGLGPSSFHRCTSAHILNAGWGYRMGFEGHCVRGPPLHQSSDHPRDWGFRVFPIPSNLRVSIMQCLSAASLRRSLIASTIVTSCEACMRGVDTKKKIEPNQTAQQ